MKPIAHFLAVVLIVNLCLPPTQCFSNAGDDEDQLDLHPEFDGINIDGVALESVVDDSLRSIEEKAKSDHYNSASQDKHPFEKACPYGYFVCDNGECIAPRWRCDGHADCDDYSDELNCTTVDMPRSALLAGSSPITNFTQRLPNITTGHMSKLPVQVYGLDFNSTIEPLMIFSTGQSIRGLWMRSRIYFDIVTRQKARTESLQPSITEAFSLFFGILGLDPNRNGASNGGNQAASFMAGTDGSSARTSDEGPSKPESTIVGLDMNPSNKEVFWVELGKDPGVYSAVIEDEQFEARQRRQFHGHKKIVEYGLLSPEDIALDTVGRNAYITDAGLPAVVVCSYVHVHCRILVNTKIHKPRAIIADSSSGWIIFTDWGDHPGIYLVTMDGKRRDTLIETDVVWPNGLAQDYTSNYLYWADARLNKIERVDLKTRKRFELIKEVNTNPFSVSVFEQRIYWSDWSGNDIKTCDKMSGNNTRTVMHADDIYGIHIYHPDMHKSANEPATNPCWSKHCSHLCLLSPSASSTFGLRRSGSIGATCACPDSMALSIFDRATCYEVHLSFLLMNVNNYIAQVFPERIGLRVVEEIVYSKEHAIQDIASDWLHYKLFLFDASRKQILVADFSGRQVTFQKFANIGTSSIRGLIYDLQSDNLFWLDSEQGTLTLCSVRGAKMQKVLRTRLTQATAMVLDTKNRVFYIALQGQRPRVIRTDIMANELSDVVVLDKSDIGRPVGLYLDEDQQRLYWADGKYGQIESIGLDVKSRSAGTKPDTRIKHRGRLGSIVAFTVYGEHLMWVVEGTDYLYKARRDDRSSRPVPFRLPPSASKDLPSSEYKRLITVNPMSETIFSPCSKRACSHACIIDRDREAKCICPDGFKLQIANKSNCIETSKADGPDADPLLPSAIVSRLAANSDKHAMSSHAIDQLTIAHRDSQPVVATVSHVMSGDMPHVDGDHFTDHKSQLTTQHHDSTPMSDHHAEPISSGAHDSVTEDPVNHSNKFVWLITFLLVLTAAGLITVVSLMVLNKQGRLSRQMSQLTVSFIPPSTSSGGCTSSMRDAGIDKDKTMLLLDTDS